MTEDGIMQPQPNCSLLEAVTLLDPAGIQHHHLPLLSSNAGSTQSLTETVANQSQSSAGQLDPLVPHNRQNGESRKRPVPKPFGVLKKCVFSEAHIKQPMLDLKEDYAEDFETTAEALANRLLQFSDCLRGGLGVSREVLDQILLQLRKKKILISVLGRHNTGKSTFLNALLANELLPMNAQNETSVKVKIKHEESVHRFPCPKQGNDPKSTCKACPYILEEQGNYCKLYQGAHNITTALKKVNSTVRTYRKKVTAEYEVHGYVSCISEAATPPNWSVLLADNPGFGEGNQEEIMMNARASLTASSAYVYIMSYTHLEDEKDTSALKHVYQKDKDVFMKNRLLVVITNFDSHYRALLESFDENEEIITSDDVKRKVKEHVQRATDGACDIPDENVVPICGQWALFSKLLHHEPENKTLQVLVNKCLIRYGGPTTKGPDMAIKLEEASGIRVVEERIKEMAQSSFESWVESTRNAFDGFLKQTCQRFDSAAQSLQDFVNGEEEEYKLHKEQLADLDMKRKEFTDSLSGETSEVYRELSEVYPKDTEKPIEEGKKTVKDKTDSFKNICVAFCADNYQPQQFEKDVDDFLEEAYDCVQSTLNSTYSFHLVNSSLQNQMVQQSERFTALKDVATDILCEIMETTSTGETGTEPSKEESIESIMKQNPTTLKELRKKVEIPPLSKKWFRRLSAFWNFFTRKHQGAGLRPEELEKPLNVLREGLEDVCCQYFEMIKPQIVMYFYDVYHQRAKMFLEAFDNEFMDCIQSRKEELVEEKGKIDGYREEVQTLRVWSVHLNMLRRHLFRKADECLKQLSTKERRTPELTKAIPQSNDAPCAVRNDVSTIDPIPVQYTSREEQTMADEGSSAIEMNSLPQPPVITARVEGQSIKVPVEEDTPIWGVLDNALQAHGLNLDEYDGEADKHTKSSEFAGNYLFVQDKSTSAGIDEQLHVTCGFKSHRPRSGALLRRVHDQARSRSAGVYIDLPKFGHRQLTTWGEQSFQEEDSHIGDLVCSISVPRKRAKEDPQSEGAAAQLLKRMLIQSSPNEHTGTPVSFESDFQEDLMTTCEIVKTRLEELQREHKVVSAEQVHDWKQAEERKICIAVFGKSNSGKSLLLNALVGQRILPVSRAKHTMVKVKLQHDRSLHHPKVGPGHPESEPCEKCPILMKGSSELCRGIKNISDTLQLINESLQTDNLQADNDYIIHANIPLLSYIPEPWQVHLVDNPGFVELTEVEMERQLAKMMAPSAYIHTVSYNELQDALSGAAFKLIFDQDQAKAALLDNRLVVVVTHFDCYYNALSQEGMLDTEQVKELVCTGIKTATSRTFPKESVIPICNHWAIAARQLIRQQRTEKYEQRALNCFHYCADERIRNLLIGDESSHAVAQKLDIVSGIKQLETRIIQMSQRAYVESVLSITRNLSAHLVTAMTKLRSYTNSAGKVVQNNAQILKSAAAYRERITSSKAEMARFISGPESSVHQELQSHCEEDIQGLLRTLQSKSKELQQLFKQDCTAKISATVTFGPLELKEGLGKLVQDTLEGMQMLWNDMEFESTRRCFAQRIKEADEKYEQMRQDAYKFCTGEVSGHKEGVYMNIDQDAILKALKKILQLQELKISVEFPSTGGVFRKEKNYTRLQQLQKSFNQFEKIMDENLSTYIDSIRPQLMELLCGHFCDHIKKQQEAFDEDFSSHMHAREMEIVEIMKVKENFEAEVKRLDMWSNHLEKLQKHLERKCEEILKHD